MSVSVSVAVAQFAATADKSANIKKSIEAVAEAAASGARLVVLPEASMYADAALATGSSEYAERLDGPYVSAVQEAARAHQIAVVTGMTELDTTVNQTYNTAVAVDPSGKLIGSYRKLHLCDSFGFCESDMYSSGDFAPPLTFELGGLTVGVMICYDMRFPEVARYLVDAGATVLATPSAWLAGPTKESHWEILARARAIENTCYVLATSQTGPACTAQSMVVDPMGTVVAGAGEEPGQAVAAISAERVAQVRAKNPALVNRRFRVQTLQQG